MRVLKILAYLCLIGFVVDLFYKFFNFESFKENVKFQGIKASIAIAIQSLITVLLWQFKGGDIALKFFGITFIPFLFAEIYFVIQHQKEIEKE
ncbi:hypothetical protein [Tenacibaculum maritimum]|uniref:hypothetical protein n=1 Tax=Tenacibaculum maritimum TaxID=107401 RepID=UPI0012E420FC|nr:hypothetical protein [Tenacibaculum maritimum]CAA0253766.1 membrane hypothetical protein [Tenacibaculum maritimum]